MEKMTLENRFYDQGELAKMLYDGKISGIDYVTHQSEERTNQLKEYCAKRAVPENEESAGSYLNHILREEERSHTEGLD